MEILPGIVAKDLCVVVGDTIIFSDVHIGLEEALNKQGILIPRFQFNELVVRIKKILDDAHPFRVVIAGDLKHEFGTISKQEWRHTLQFLDLLQLYAHEIVLIRGNHDTILGPLAEKKGLMIVDHYDLHGVSIFHGNSLPKNINGDVIIIGHEHPAITLRDGPRSELVKCFLVGQYKKKKIIVLPSFNLVTEGSDVIQEKRLGPFLSGNLGDFIVYVVSDQIYKFGKLKRLMT